MKWHHHFSYYAFSYRWITGVWGCCATSSLLDNHRLRPRVRMKHTVEYPRSATTLWCVHSHGTHQSNGQTQQGERRERLHTLYCRLCHLLILQKLALFPGLPTSSTLLEDGEGGRKQRSWYLLMLLALFIMDIQVDLHFPSHVSLEARDLISKVGTCTEFVIVSKIYITTTHWSTSFPGLPSPLVYSKL